MLLVFETYQKARLVFVQTMAELATRASNVKCLESAGVLGLYTYLNTFTTSVVDKAWLQLRHTCQTIALMSRYDVFLHRI